MSLQKSIMARVAAVAAMLLVCASLFAQNITVKGTVTDASGEPIVGAAVMIKGTTNGVTTDLDGHYAINVSSNATLRFTALSYADQDVPVRGRATINVSLVEDSERLQEATVTAEFGMKRIARSVGASVQSVKAEDIADAGREAFTSALQGRVSGMTVTSTGGAPGASTSVILRSATSISGSNQPLYVVDGVPINNTTFHASNSFADADISDSMGLMYNMDFSSRGNDINPDDIESMTVLKGAAAAALYGSDASNGAIIITTKKGSSGKGKVTYSNSFRWDKAYDYPQIQNKYSNGKQGSTNFYYQSRYGNLYPEGIKLYDNIGALLQTGFSQTHNVAVEGGTDKVTVRGGLSYVDQKGVVKTTDFNRLNLTLSGRAQVTKWLAFDASMQYMKTGNSKVQKGLNGVLYRAAHWPLTDDMTVYMDADGKMKVPDLYTDYDLWNPFFALYKNVNRDDTNRFLGTFNMNITPTKHTFIRATYGMDFSIGEYKVYTHPYWGNRTAATYGYGSMNYAKPTYRDTNVDVLAGYNNEFGKFTLAVQVGYHQKENKNSTFSAYGEHFKVIDFYGLANCDPTTIKARTVNKTRRIQAISAQLELGYNNMAFLTLRARNDWSSTLPKNNNHYFYPAVEGSFVATELPFLQEQDYVSYLKLRGAIAKVGKDADPLSIYPSLEAVEDVGGGFRYGFTGPNLALKPEMTTSYEVGFEARLFNDRVNTDFSYYWTKCENQYIKGFRLSYATGFVLNNMNVGTFTTRGWEFHIDADILRLSNGLRWNLGLNMDHSTSNVTYLPENVSEYYDAYTWIAGNIRNGISVGNPITTITGLAFERNKNGDLLIDAKGAPIVGSTWEILGDRQPKLTFGIPTNLSWRQFRLSALFSGRLGGTVVNGTKRDMMSNGSSWESVKMREADPFIIQGVMKDGKENSSNPTPNNIAIDPTIYANTTYVADNEKWIEKNVNFLRLSEVRLTYTVPQKWLKQATHNFLSAASVYVMGTDLFTWTNYSGIDAVGNSNSAAMGGVGGIGIDYWGIPSPRGISCGVNLTF